MRMRYFLVLSILLSCFGPAGMAQTQQSSTESERRITRKVIPTYPEIARKMNISGTVKILATVSPDGSVKSVQAMGGSPVLIQSAQDAVTKWRFAPASAESKELIELHFDRDR